MANRRVMTQRNIIYAIMVVILIVIIAASAMQRMTVPDAGTAVTPTTSAPESPATP